MNMLQHLLDKLSASLPLVMMALLASGSWWLVRSVPEWLPAAPAKTIRQEPDYRLGHFSITTFDAQGRRVHAIKGEQAQHFPASEMLHIEGIRIHTETAQGAQLDARAALGMASDDGQHITLTGNAQVVRHPDGRSPQMALRGERLVVLPEQNRVVSKDPVHITRGFDTFTAQSLDFNGLSGQHVLEGRVRGTLAPPP